MPARCRRYWWRSVGLKKVFLVLVEPLRGSEGRWLVIVPRVSFALLTAPGVIIVAPFWGFVRLGIYFKMAGTARPTGGRTRTDTDENGVIAGAGVVGLLTGGFLGFCAITSFMRGWRAESVP